MKTFRWMACALALALLAAPAARAANPPTLNALTNGDWEDGNMYPWFKDGAGAAGAEGCCGQHMTFFWPSEHYNTHMCPSSPLCGNALDTWDGYIEPQGNYVALAQGLQFVNGNFKFRLSTWMSTWGMTGSLRWYAASGGTRLCPQTSVTFPTFANVACILTLPSNPAGFNVHMAGQAGSGAWVVSDDWALTRQINPPYSSLSRWTIPIKYWARDYASSTDIAAADWNSIVGKTLFVKAANEAEARLIIDGTEDADNLHFGSLGVGSDGKRYVLLNMWYFNRWGTNAKVSTISHELGHALTLDHIETCQLMNGGSSRYFYCGIWAPTPADADAVRAIYP